MDSSKTNTQPTAVVVDLVADYVAAGEDKGKGKGKAVGPGSPDEVNSYTNTHSVVD